MNKEKLVEYIQVAESVLFNVDDIKERKISLVELKERYNIAIKSLLSYLNIEDKLKSEDEIYKVISSLSSEERVLLMQLLKKVKEGNVD